MRPRHRHRTLTARVYTQVNSCCPYSSPVIFFQTLRAPNCLIKKRAPCNRPRWQPEPVWWWQCSWCAARALRRRCAQTAAGLVAPNPPEENDVVQATCRRQTKNTPQETNTHVYNHTVQITRADPSSSMHVGKITARVC